MKRIFQTAAIGPGGVEILVVSVFVKFLKHMKKKGKILKSETFRKFSGVVKRAGPELLYKLRLCKHYYMSSFIAKFYAKRIKMRVGLM